MSNKQNKKQAEDTAAMAETVKSGDEILEKPREIGGPKDLEPTRYGDWEKDGRCIDF